MKSVMDGTILCGLCLISSALMSCARNPVIDEFSVSPQAVCKGDPVTVRWKTSYGGASLHVEPMGRARLSSSVPEDGSTELRIFGPTAITLEVRSNTSMEIPPDSRSNNVGLFHSSTTDGINSRVPCQTTSSFTINEILAVRPNSLRVITVASNRTATVTHEGRTVPLSTSPSEFFRDRPVNGSWTLTTPVFMDERCCEAAGINCGREIIIDFSITSVCPERMPGGSSETPPPVPPEGVGLPSDWRPCGLEGGGCCSGAQCGVGLVCYSFQCQRGNLPGPVTCSGAPRNSNYQVYPYAYKDPWGCSVMGAATPFEANSPEEAQQCAANYGQRIGATPVYLPIEQHPPFRKRLRGDNRCNTVNPSVYDLADAEACARHLWCEPPNDCELLERGTCQ